MKLFEPLTKPPPSWLATPSSLSDPITPRPFWLPPTTSSVKLMATGATVGTVVDSLHNQILLEYHVAPIQIPSLLNQDAYWLASSWTVPPLLAGAYLVLGGILPRVVQKAIRSLQKTVVQEKNTPTSATSVSASVEFLRNRALWAVTTSALIVKLSDLLERHGSCWEILGGGGDAMMNIDWQHLIVLFGAAAAQWWCLDGTPAAFVLAALTAYGGPLAELPFVAANVWTYLPEAAHYFPMQGDGSVAMALRALLPGGQDLAISYLSAPCYFAVTMDAIALGRWFDAQDDEHQ